MLFQVFVVFESCVLIDRYMDRQTAGQISRYTNRQNDRKDIYRTDKQDKYTDRPNLLGFQNSCSSRVFLDYLCMYCKPSNSAKDRCIHYKVDFKSLSWIVWSLGCHNDSLVLLVFFEDIHIRTGSLSVFWVTRSSSWHPKERLDLTHIMLSSGVPGRVTTRAVFGLAERSLAWRCSDWRFHQYWILMNGSYMSSAHQWLQWWWSLSRWKSPQEKLLIVWYWVRDGEGEEEKERKKMWCMNKSLFDEYSTPVIKGASHKPAESKYSSCHDHYQLVTTDALSVQWLKYSVSHVFPFSRCPSELPSIPSIVVLPCLILLSHPPTVFVWRSLFPRWARVCGCQAERPQGRALFEPLLSPWFDAVDLSVVGCLCQAPQEVHYFRPLQRQS